MASYLSEEVSEIRTIPALVRFQTAVAGHYKVARTQAQDCLDTVKSGGASLLARETAWKSYLVLHKRMVGFERKLVEVEHALESLAETGDDNGHRLSPRKIMRYPVRDMRKMREAEFRDRFHQCTAKMMHLRSDLNAEIRVHLEKVMSGLRVEREEENEAVMSKLEDRDVVEDLYDEMFSFDANLAAGRQ